MTVATKNKIKQYLDDHKVAYKGIEHAPAASAEEYNRTLGSRLEQQAKVLLLRYKKDGSDHYAVMSIQAQKRADLDSLKDILGASKIRMADRDCLQEVTGCNFGELHPFATLFGLKLLMDKDLIAQDEIYINAGCLDYSIVVDPKIVEKLENPIIF